MSVHWPVTLTSGPIELRPLRHRDAREWRRVRAENVDWLRPWEATSPDGSSVPRSYGSMLRQQSRQARAGDSVPLAVALRGDLVGQIGLNPISWGSLRSGAIGYWISRQVAGEGITPTAVAMLTDHALFTMGLHRVEVNIRPENVASLRVVEKLGFRDEGLRRKYLHIDGKWCDHRTFALTTEDLPHGLLRPWIAATGNPESTSVMLQHRGFE